MPDARTLDLASSTAASHPFPLSMNNGQEALGVFVRRSFSRNPKGEMV